VRINLQPAYVLHSRPYRDTSLLLEVFTAEHGRISLVGRGARRPARGGSSGALLQPFIPLLLSFGGRSELKNLTAIEAAGGVVSLSGNRLFSGMYVNELLVRLLHRHDPYPELFAAYGQVLQDLAVTASLDGILRHFEFSLLDELGYGFDLGVDGHSGEAVRADCWYHYQPELGLVSRGRNADPSRPAFAGEQLLRMAGGEFDGEVRLTAKRLMRQALAGQLGDAPLNSRDLFRARPRGAAPQKTRAGSDGNNMSDEALV
jgi:DNA repair protein RecO (recombination protein O)